MPRRQRLRRGVDRCRACTARRRSTRSGKAAATSCAWTCCARWRRSRRRGAAFFAELDAARGAAAPSSTAERAAAAPRPRRSRDARAARAPRRRTDGAGAAGVDPAARRQRRRRRARSAPRGSAPSTARRSARWRPDAPIDALIERGGAGSDCLSGSSGPTAMDRVDAVVVGAGVVGLASARELAAHGRRDARARGRVGHRYRHQFAQQRGHPCRSLRRARLAEGAALRRGPSGAVPPIARRTACRIGAAASSSSPLPPRRSTPCARSSEARAPTASPGCAGSRAPRPARSSRR